MTEPELELPYWQLDDHAGRTTLRTMLRELPAALGTVAALIRRAAPRAGLAICVLQLVSGAASAFGLLATAGVLESLLADGPTADRVVAALPALSLVAGAYAIRGAVDAGVAVAHAHVVPAVRRAAEGGLIDAALTAPLDAFDDPDFYDRMHRARDRAVYHLERSADNLIELAGASFAVLAAAGSLTALHPALLPALALGVLPDGWAVLHAARLGYAGTRRTVTLDRRVMLVTDLATERASAAEIRACQAGPFVRAEYAGLADTLRAAETSVAVAQARARAYGRALAGLGLAATFVLLGLLLHAGWVPLATAGAAVVAIRAAGSALTRLVLAGNQLFEQNLYVADYQAFLRDAVTRSRPPRPVSAPLVPSVIRLDGVGFTYPGSDEPALREIDLTLRAGETIALVGENGSGKTTLAKLVAGLYSPTAGRITWDGVDVRDLDPASLADRVVVVLQEPVRWPHDARTNVRIGRHDRLDPSDAALAEAAGSARADEVVAGLPDGWRTLLSKYFRGGRELSGGQWQRLAVARGLFRDAPLLIWDEPTAPLDPRAEYEVYESLRRIAADRTTILITHRLASVRHADRIYLLHDGALAEQGTHAELVAADGRYAELYALQAKTHDLDQVR